jgi:hypothetical protein
MNAKEDKSNQSQHYIHTLLSLGTPTPQMLEREYPTREISISVLHVTEKERVYTGMSDVKFTRDCPTERSFFGEISAKDAGCR